ncbi:hypothetical protein [Psychroserpens sp. NJDZ02]|uniref:hypothetical protein n=1 Tax=Psychroserpens sp. NJDZ02 TaxID=2570561 RepID=UPI0010A8A2AE|nr:hypothetical protein [Psychroserpens sp. NJDZ02]QCE40978.1 hypothetical protein E9099_05950 [Psychroserpens sp. NJDZ02]
MKQYIIVLLISFTSINSAKSQFFKNNVIYTTGELNLGNYIGVDLNLNYVTDHNYSLKIGYTGNIRKPKSQPENYSSGVSGVFALGFNDPYDQIENYQIGIGKIYNLNPSGTIRANVSLGLGYTIVTTPQNWQENNDRFFTKNYTWDYNKQNTVSLVINPKIEFPLTRFYGLTLSPMIILNKHSSYFGIGIGIVHMIGALR